MIFSNSRLDQHYGRNGPVKARDRGCLTLPGLPPGAPAPPTPWEPAGALGGIPVRHKHGVPVRHKHGVPVRHNHGVLVRLS